MNGHPAHRGFVSVAERDEVLSLAKLRSDCEGHPRPAWVWSALITVRAGSRLPVPTLAHLCEHWKCETIVDCECPDAPQDSHPDQRGFLSEEERSAVMLNAMFESDRNEETFTEAHTYQALIARRAGTSFLLPTFTYMCEYWGGCLSPSWDWYKRPQRGPEATS